MKSRQELSGIIETVLCLYLESVYINTYILGKSLTLLNFYAIYFIFYLLLKYRENILN